MATTACGSHLESNDPLNSEFEWIHCNMCFVELNDHVNVEVKQGTGLSGYSYFQLLLHPKSFESLKFALLTCGHIFCNNCFHPQSVSDENQCPICFKNLAHYFLVGEVPSNAPLIV